RDAPARAAPAARDGTGVPSARDGKAIPSGRDVPPSPDPAGEEPVVLAVDGVVKSFGGVKALRGVSLIVHPGEVHALIGPNGSGKSTLINIVSGIYRAEAGTVSIGGRRID